MELYRHYWKRYRIPFLIAVGCVFLEAVCDLMQPTLMSRMIDNGIKNGRVGTALHYGMLMLLITLAGMGFAALRNVLSSRVSRSFGADLRYDVFRRIVSLSKTGTDRFETGSLITRVTNDTGQVMLFVSGMMRVFFKAPVTCAGSIVLAVMLSPRLSIVLFAAVAVVSGLIAVSMKLSYRFFALVQRAIDRVNTVVGEYLMGVRLVKAFGRYGDEEKKFGGANTDLARKSNSSQAVIAVFSPLMSLAVSAGIALILYFGSILFEAGQIEVGRVAAFVNYMTQILTSLLMMTNIFNTFVRTRASTERISEILDSTEDFSGSGAAAEIPSGGIEFRNVTFAYPNGSGLPAVKNLSFSVREGETLAVIRPNRLGKIHAGMALPSLLRRGKRVCFGRRKRCPRLGLQKPARNNRPCPAEKRHFYRDGFRQYRGRAPGRFRRGSPRRRPARTGGRVYPGHAGRIPERSGARGRQPLRRPETARLHCTGAGEKCPGSDSGRLHQRAGCPDGSKSAPGP